MAIVYCADCGERVSTEAAVCPHCGKPRQDAVTTNGWASAVIKNFAIVSGVLTLLGGAIAFFYQRHQEFVVRSDEIHRDAELQQDREDRLKLSQKAEARESKRPVLDLQLKTYESVLANIAGINALLNSAEKTKATKPIKDFITDYLGRMPFVEDRRTEAVMEMVNIAIQLPYSPPSFPAANPEKCVMDDLTPILAHCMQLSIATSWDFLPKPLVIDDYLLLDLPHLGSFTVASGPPKEQKPAAQ